MKTKRLKRIKLEDQSCYHVMSRIAERRFYLGSYEKNMFCNMMKRVALFSGIHILTYCVMDNHFHLLIEIPKRPPLSLKDIKARLPFIYRGSDLHRVLCEFKHWEKRGNHQMVEELKQQYERRMYDLSEFMKTLKQRFSIWYNRNHDRKGTLWEEDRFTSVLIQSPNGRSSNMGCLAILTIAAYIDLNSIRAGIVNDPKDYMWSGYGAATAKHANARSGITSLMRLLEKKEITWSKAKRSYENYLYFKRKKHEGNPHSARQKENPRNEILTCAELIQHRVRCFSAGLVIGTENFVSRIILQNRESFRTRQGIYPLLRGNRKGLYADKNA